MAWLRRLGHTVMSLDDYVEDRARYRIPPARSVVVTVDARDGALPHPAGMPVTVFVDAAAAAASGGAVAIGLHGGDGEPSAEDVTRRRQDLEARLGRPVEHFSHPVGASPGDAARVASELGFRSGCSNEPGLNGPLTPVHRLRRIPVSTQLGIRRLAVSLLTGSAPRGARRM
jgi:hypothetical protein